MRRERGMRPGFANIDFYFICYFYFFEADDTAELKNLVRANFFLAVRAINSGWP